MLETMLIAIIITGISFFGLGIGVFLFGKSGKRAKCGTDPTLKVAESADCPSRKHGLCPTIDRTGAVKMVNQARLTFPSAD